MIEKDYPELLTYLSLDINKSIKKRVATLLLMLICGVAAALFIDIGAGVILAGLSLFVYKYEYFQKSSLVKKKSILKQLDFVNFFAYLLIFLQNKENIYQSLFMCKDFCSDNIKEELNTLIEDIGNDKSINPYIKFGQFFYSESIMQIMMLIHQYEVSGYDPSHLQRFSATLSKLKHNTYDQFISSTLGKLDLIMFMPMVVTIGYVLLFAVGILDNIGGFIDV